MNPTPQMIEGCKHDYARYSGTKFMHCAQCKKAMPNEFYWNSKGGEIRKAIKEQSNAK